MREDGELHPERIAPYADLLRHSGVAGVFVNGTTGEGASLSTDERLLLARHWVDAAGGGLKVFVHVRHTSLKECQRMAAHARDVGAWAIALVAPYFFRPATPAELVEWCAAAAEAAPGMPLYYYHIPCMTGVNFAMADFLAQAASSTPMKTWTTTSAVWSSAAGGSTFSSGGTRSS